MTVSKLTAAGLLVVLALMPSEGAKAAEAGITIKIDDPRWEKLPKSEQDALIKKLKDGGALGANDTVVYVAPKKDRPVEKDVGLDTILAPFGRMICGKKNSASLEACSELSGGAADKCRDDTKASAKKNKGLCG
jgi:hypothetical protein